MIPLIVDTDLGGDIDDAFALGMALNAQTVDLLGVTTVYLGAAWRRGIIERMLRVYGREAVPVYDGSERPLRGSWGENARPALPNEAARFIVRAARARPVTVLAIGPMTNIALALLLAPDIAPRLTVCAMGGMLSRAHAEWNVLCDPEAADIVLASGAHVTLVPLDVTERLRLTRARAKGLVQGGGERLAFLRGELDRFFDQFDFAPTLHDPLALLCLLKPDVCDYAMKDIRVETRGERTRGVTVDARYPERAPIRCAVRVRRAEALYVIQGLIRGEA